MTALFAAISPFLAMMAMLGFAGLLVWLWVERRRVSSRPFPGNLTFRGALAASAVWCAVYSVYGPLSTATNIAEHVRNLSWLAFLYLHYRAVTPAPMRSVAVLHATLAAFLVVLLVLDLGVQFGLGGPMANGVAVPLHPAVRMLVAIGALIVIDHAARATPPETPRPMLATIGALAAMWAYDLNLFVIGYLADKPALALILLQPLFAALLVPAFAVDAFDRGTFRLKLSRAATFRTMVLVGISAYLVLMALTAMAVRLMGRDYGDVAQGVFLILSLGMGATLLASKSARAWMQVMLTKHFFEHRYDYRTEWLRFTATIGRGTSGDFSLQARTVKAVAELMGSPAGLLMAPDDHGDLVLQETWNWPTLKGETGILPMRLMTHLQDSGRIIDLEDLRSGNDVHHEAAMIAPWLMEESRAWILVPLVHFERLVGLVILQHAVPARELDWEDLDVLRVVGRQAATYLAESKTQEALSEARRFDEFNRRFAFIMHDVKNISSQLGLLAQNAEKHANNPAFIADMVTTLRSSSSRLNGLLARLSQQGSVEVHEPTPTPVGPILARIADTAKARHPVLSGHDADAVAITDAARLEQILTHLVHNAIDASGPHEPVQLLARRDGGHVIIDVLDRGCGMSAEFIRTKLFQPFVSTKDTGFGIGAFEARNLAASLHARLTVESQEGQGTRFTLTMPAAQSAARPTQRRLAVDEHEHQEQAA